MPEASERIMIMSRHKHDLLFSRTKPCVLYRLNDRFVVEIVCFSDSFYSLFICLSQIYSINLNLAGTVT